MANYSHSIDTFFWIIRIKGEGAVWCAHHGCTYPTYDWGCVITDFVLISQHAEELKELFELKDPNDPRLDNYYFIPKDKEARSDLLTRGEVVKALYIRQTNVTIITDEFS